jgi:hypothetical protein
MAPSFLHPPRARLLTPLYCLIIIASASACSIATIKTTVPPVPTSTPHVFICPAGAYCAAIPGPVCDTGGAAWMDDGLSTRCGSSSLLSNVDPKVIALMGYVPPQRQFAIAYTTAITVDFSASPDALAGFTRSSASGTFTADILSSGYWFLQAVTRRGTYQLLDRGSVTPAASYRIKVTFDGAAATLSINGTQVGSTSDSPVTTTSLLAILLQNHGSSAETIGLSDFVYSPS